jgi:predicted XRE-type DNA-binding protein
MQGFSSHIDFLKRHGVRRDDSIILLMRMQLIKIINSEIKSRGWSQRDAAKVLSVAQPRVAELSVLATEKFSVESLMKYLCRLGLKVSLTVKPSKHYVPAKRQRQKKSSGRMKAGGKDDQGPSRVVEEMVCAGRINEQ